MSPTLLILPRRQPRAPEPFTPEQVSAIDPQVGLGEFAGRLSGSEMQAVDAALRAVLSLD
ncbi:MAG TPA: hypothetical protein PLV68_14960 [Ilumatobacteraceae bacterium]|nr:hypothetical protein [Ilumatobacteraceae bacterium]